jgi:hypothetical protein
VSQIVDDEDVQLIAEALYAAGWKRETGKHGFGSKMIELAKMDEKLKAILAALIEAKLSEQPMDLDPKQALRALQDATAVVPLDIFFKMEKEVANVHMLGTQSMAMTKKAEVVTDITNMHQYQLHALVNFLRKYTPP